MSYLHHSGTEDTATVPTGRWVRRYSCVAGAAGATIVITRPGESAEQTITLPPLTPFADEFADIPNARDGVLIAGTTIAFAGTTSFFVRYA